MPDREMDCQGVRYGHPPIDRYWALSVPYLVPGTWYLVIVSTGVKNARYIRMLEC